MGEIVSFRPQEGQVHKSRASMTGAQILFFTGVRYERMIDSAAALVEGDSDAPRSGGARSGKRRRRG